MNVSIVDQGQAEFAAFVGIDWADRKHVWRMYVPERQAFEAGELDHRPESTEAWVASLAARFGQRPVAVALEQSRGALIYMLMKYPNLVFFPIHPAMLARYRESFSPSGAKDDDRDVELILDLLLRHRERLRPLQPETTETRLLMLLTEQRREWVDQHTACLNRLTDNVKVYFPQILDWFSDLNSPVVTALLRRWPTLGKLKAARSAVLRNFFLRHNKTRDNIEERIARIRQAVEAVTDPAILEACTERTPTLLAQLAVLDTAVKGLNKRIAVVFESHPDAFIFQSLPGAGPALEPRLLAGMGTHRDRFAGADAAATFVGIAPVRIQSGKTSVVVFRHACPKFLRQTFHEWANCSIRYCDWARQHYQHQRDRGKGHHAAVRSVAYKWMRILYRCWIDRAPYDPERHHQALSRRLAPRPGSTTALWKTGGRLAQPASFCP